MELSPRRNRSAGNLVAGLCFAAALHAQTTQGLILGRVTDANTGGALPRATVTCTGDTLTADRTVLSDGDGYYRFAFLSPGTYRVRVTFENYQAQTIYNIRIAVASRLDLDFPLRDRKYVFESGNYRQLSLPNTKTLLPFFGPDVDPSRSGVVQPDTGRPSLLESSVSEVIARDVLDTLPLAGRDAYALLITQPGVTADTTTSRGLGLSVNGQRPSASNYLLDGLDNNNHLTTGPLALASPDMVEEYRLSTNNFSAEYGGSSGFIANAISRPGTSRLHGLAYGYLGDEILNANSFQANANASPRPGFKSAEGGLLVTGPIVREKLFGSFSLDGLRLRDRGDPEPFVLPSPSYLTSLHANYPNSYTTLLLTEYPAVVTPTTDSNQFGCKPETVDFHCVPLRPLDSENTLLLLPRADALTRDSRDHWFARVAVARDSNQPDFLYTPYPQFATAITSNETSAALGWIAPITPALTASVRAGWAAATFLLPRPHDEVPGFSARDSTLSELIALPGAPLPYAVRNLDRHPEASADLIWSHGPHVVKFGGSLLFRFIENQFEDNNTGTLVFTSAQALSRSEPAQIALGVSRQDGSANQLDNRRYENAQWSAYLQDTVKLTSRLGLNAGLRVEAFGYPRNTGASDDATVQLGSGDDPNSQVAAAALVYGKTPFYRSPPLDWAPRVGAAYRLDDKGYLVARAAWGLFYDEPFDNLWESGALNSVHSGTINFPSTFTYSGQSPSALVTGLGPANVTTSTTDTVTAFAPGFHSGRVQSYLFGIENRFTQSLSLELETLGSSGSGLITTNILNRNDNTQLFLLLRSNRTLPLVAYRGNQGYSTYHALAAVLRYRSARRFFQISYTWSHSIDNQSEPLAGEFGDLSFASGSGSLSSPAQASTFTQTAPSRYDRGDSDFDQRQNLVAFGSFALPSFGVPALNGWRVSGLGAVRSGLPFTVTAGPGLSDVMNQHANLIDPSAARVNLPGSVPGTRLLLNAAAFSPPASGVLGNLNVGSSGRNSFRGPGFYSMDGSLSRTFAIPRLGELARATVRLDALNLLNHTNLSIPVNALAFSTFGLASYGLQENSSVGVPASSPLAETGRQLRLILRFAF